MSVSHCFLTQSTASTAELTHMEVWLVCITRFIYCFVGDVEGFQYSITVHVYVNINVYNMFNRL